MFVVSPEGSEAMTILDELAALARERHYGHGEREALQAADRALCYLSKIPVEWCLGCKRDWHTQRTPPEAVARELMAGVDTARDPDYCPVCGPQGYGACRCEIASNE